MSNGDSLDGFVFPPFIPTSSTRPAQAPPAAPQPPAQESAPEPAEASGGRMIMPWDLETPIVRQADEAPAPAGSEPETASAGDDDEDLPWLEVPAPREAEAPAAEVPPAPAQDDGFPDWMAWDQRDETAAEADVRDTVAPIAGLEDFVPLDELGGRVAPAPAVEWADAEPAPAAEAFPELVFDDAPSAEAAAPSADDWSLSTPEAAAPPPVTEAPLPAWEESPAAAEPSFEISVDEADAGTISIEPAVAEGPSFLADEEPAVTEPPSFPANEEPAEAEAQPFVADAEAVMAAEPEPVVSDAPAVEPDSFTAAAAAEADAASPFDDVATRLEAIARMLRERPDELLSGGSPDPLALLVTGYVMGYTARGGR